MFIQVDWFKDTGKWYSGGEVELQDGTNLWDEDLKQQIIDNQNIMGDLWQNGDYWHIVISDTHADSLSPNYRGFFKHYFPPGSFKGIKKQEKGFVKQNI